MKSELNVTFSQKCSTQVTSAEVSKASYFGTVDNDCCAIISQPQKRGRVKKQNKKHFPHCENTLIIAAYKNKCLKAANRAGVVAQ